MVCISVDAREVAPIPGRVHVNTFMASVIADVDALNVPAHRDIERKQLLPLIHAGVPRQHQRDVMTEASQRLRERRTDITETTHLHERVGLSDCEQNVQSLGFRITRADVP